MKWYTRSCERPRKRSANEALPSSVSNRYALSIRTHGSSCRRRASSSPRRVSSFSSLSSLIRAASHSLCVPVRCFVIALFSFLLRGLYATFVLRIVSGTLLKCNYDVALFGRGAEPNRSRQRETEGVFAGRRDALNVY